MSGMENALSVNGPNLGNSWLEKLRNKTLCRCKEDHETGYM